MKKGIVYDSVWSLGQWCVTAMSLKDLGLRSASGPFDWMGGPHELIGYYAEMIVKGFPNFFLKENMRKLRENPKEGTEHWFDDGQGWEIRHEFKMGVPFEENYAKYRAQLDRRIERLLASLRSGGQVLLVHVRGEGRYAEGEVVGAARRIRAAFPDTKIDLLVLEPDSSVKDIVFEEPESGVFVAIGDFYDMRRYDVVRGNKPLILSVFRRIRMRGRWRNLLRARIESLRKRLLRRVKKRRGGI